MICVRPAGAEFDPWTLAAIGFAIFGAGVTVTVKRLTHTEPPLTIVFWTYVLMGLFAVVPAALGWHPPGVGELLLVLAIAVCSTVGQTCMVHGLRAGEATALAPFEYSRLVYATVFGAVLFAEIPDRHTWLGATLIVTSTLYIAAHEARRARRD